MKYITSVEAAEKMGVTKRYINALCAKGSLSGAYKEGRRWMIPESAVPASAPASQVQRKFNATGACDAKTDYMVNLEQRLAQVKMLVDDGKYFTINRARQFGKTTILHALTSYLNHEYYVVGMDFQMQMSAAKFRNENSFSLAFAKAFVNSFRTNPNYNAKRHGATLDLFTDSYREGPEDFELVELFQNLSLLCHNLPEKMVLMIDEVDSATNNQVFLDFLAQLRGYYINRSRFATFQSVILAGVCDIKNLKRRLRPDEEHKDNSPWNIAADFNIDMSFSAEQIGGMLAEYEEDYHTGMNIPAISQEIYDYTSGYPYLVSRICQLLSEAYSTNDDKNAWSHSGILNVVRELVTETNSLFDDMGKKIRDYPLLRTLIYEILFCGKSIPYNRNTELISIGAMFGFLKDDQGQVAIANRIFEIWFYNLFIAEEALSSDTYSEGLKEKNLFVRDGTLDVDLILQKFVQHFTESFGGSSEHFIEENGRKLFLLYIRPLINGTGNYYIESRTRNMGRTDLIIDYHGNQYIIEMKIWHGEEYNRRGEEQLIGYLDDYHLKKGYMLSFNFNKNKKPGVQVFHFASHTLVEAVV